MAKYRLFAGHLNFSDDLLPSSKGILMSLQNIIETAFENRADITPTTVTPEVKEAVLETIRQLDSGKLRVAERLGVGEWKVNEWAKKAVLLSFRIQDNEVLNDGVNKYFDKVPTKFADWSEDEFRAAGFRAVPGAVARRGSFVAKNVVLMPSYVNIGAYVDEGAMVAWNVLVVREKVLCVLIAERWAEFGELVRVGNHVQVIPMIVECLNKLLGFLGRSALLLQFVVVLLLVVIHERVLLHGVLSKNLVLFCYPACYYLKRVFSHQIVHH